MTDKPDPFSILPREFTPGMGAIVRKTRTVMNNNLTSLLQQTIDQPEIHGFLPADAVRRTPLPDGTGQIINIGI
ncbi:MAG: hypothetical protein GX577_14040 [Leptolinea sp.]|nr:hypothetical protein [Leptolinea sp.]